MKIGTKISVASEPGGKVYRARVVRRPDGDPGTFAVYLRLVHQTFREHTQNEGNSWCRGWTGAAVDALRAATALLESPEPHPESNFHFHWMRR